MIITWNMQTFLFEGSSSTEQRMPFSKTPFTEIHEKNKYTAIACMPRALFFFCTHGAACIFSNVSLWTKSYSVPHISINEKVYKNQVL